MLTVLHQLERSPNRTHDVSLRAPIVALRPLGKVNARSQDRAASTRQPFPDYRPCAVPLHTQTRLAWDTQPEKRDLLFT
jgi:hypothetical protein